MTATLHGVGNGLTAHVVPPARREVVKVVPGAGRPTPVMALPQHVPATAALDSLLAYSDEARQDNGPAEKFDEAFDDSTVLLTLEAGGQKVDADTFDDALRLILHHDPIECIIIGDGPPSDNCHFGMFLAKHLIDRATAGIPVKTGRIWIDTMSGTATASKIRNEVLAEQLAAAGYCAQVLAE